ncbi:MAG: ankyrin repeat domain-containing protein, partial [Gammaproteobacteria bacterium]|nr:ankyrin repeat domain-containing protein [Gammaproteobacteria bacterium]
MKREILSVKGINYTGIRVVLLALLVICICNSPSFAEKPINKAATIELKILSESMTREDIGKIQEAIQAGADVNVRNKYGVTPLMMASQNGHVEVVKLLLAAKANVNAVDKTDGVTPLLIASVKGHTEIVKLLIAAKADVNAVRKTDGVTPLFMASRDGHTEIVKLLLAAAKANVNAADKTDGVTPLLIASVKG